MKRKSIYLAILVLLSNYAFSQNLDTEMLDDFFNSLERRNEAMGSIAISKSGELLYSKTIGYRKVKEGNITYSNARTHYKIWSITKTYTAIMIFQLIEEGKLSLTTTLDTYYPQMPNANKITIEQMLGHRSGIFDYVNDTDEEVNLRNFDSKDAIANRIAEFIPNFEPGKNFRYSNSNYLLLGYIIEILDDSTYEEALSKRITSKINLTNTYFGTNTVSNLTNKANTFYYDQGWKRTIDEATYNDHLETADGGIVSTPLDMTLFIEALFNGRLVSKESLLKMMEGQEFYRLGLMKKQFDNSKGFGHTGGWVSESSLFYYPKDSLAIAYVTNGIVLRKEEILENVLKIYHKKRFAVSVNRNLLALLTFSLVSLILVLLKYRFKLKVTESLYFGFVIAALFWIGSFIAGFLYDNYSHKTDGITELDTFYSGSGTFMSSIQFITALLFIPFLISLYKRIKQRRVNVLPIIPLFIVSISMFGSSLFPIPNTAYTLFANLIILSVVGPLLAVILWRDKQLRGIRLYSLCSLFLMLISISLVMARASIPEFVQTYWGIIQRLLFLGWTSWIVFLSFYFTKKKSDNEVLKA